MAELFALAASILQVGGAGAKLSTELYAFVSTVARADHDFSKIVNDVKSTSDVLESIRTVILAEIGLNTRTVNLQAIHDAEIIIKECNEIFGELSSIVKGSRKLKRNGKMQLTIKSQLTWPFREPRVVLLKTRLPDLNHLLSMVFNVIKYAQDQVNR